MNKPEPTAEDIRYSFNFWRRSILRKVDNKALVEKEIENMCKCYHQSHLQAIVGELQEKINVIESSPRVNNEEVGRLRAHREDLEIITKHLD